MTDLKKLRELAEKVIESKPTGTGSEWRIHYDYEKAANPQAILALIDELEKTKAQLAEAEEVILEHDKTGIIGFVKRARAYFEKWKVTHE